MEVGEIVTAYVGDRAHLHPAFAPINPVIAELSAGNWLRISLRCWRGWPDENIDQVLAARVDEHGDGAAPHHIQAATPQRKSDRKLAPNQPPLLAWLARRKH